MNVYLSEYEAIHSRQCHFNLIDFIVILCAYVDVLYCSLCVLT